MKKINRRNAILVNIIKSYACHSIDSIQDLEVFGSELHEKIFDKNLFLVDCKKAEKWIEKNYGIFDAIKKIVEYERLYFGKVLTALESPEQVYSSLVRILGDELLLETDTMYRVWDRKLSDEDLRKVKSEIKKVKIVWRKD